MHGNAKEQTEIANEKEVIEQATAKAMGKDRYGNLSQENLQKALDNITKDGNTEVLPDGINFVVKFIESDRYYQVDGDGNVTDPIEVIVDPYPGNITVGIDGEELDGSEANPYEIWCIEDLVQFSKDINYKYNNKIIELCRTLDFSSTLSYTDYKTTEYDEFLGGDGTTELMMQLSSNGKGFKPIGSWNGGTFDGKGFEIKNIYENIEGRAGLFVGLNNTKIQNLTITGEIIGTSYAGGITSGSNVDSGNTISNCINYVNVTGKEIVGGICGWEKNTNISNCKNYGIITINSSSISYGGAGGIEGYLYGGKVENCYNEGEVKGTYICGGIVATGEEIDIINCKNKGKIHSAGNYGSGGILGKHRFGTINVINCCNEATIGEESTGYSGGIVGSYVGVSYTTDRTLNIYNCYNKGDVVSENYCGGILGYQGLTSLTINLNIENCYSVGNILGKNPGGIVGTLTASDSRTTATQSIKNSYYLSTTASKAIYSGTCTGDEIIESLLIDYMKSESFLNTLNTNIDANSEWKNWKKGYDGYPVLE